MNHALTNRRAAARFERALNLVAIFSVMFFACGVAMGQDTDGGWDFDLPNIKTPTLGGKQFWTDHQWRRGWRIQQNAITGHWRLLNADNVRQAWGSRRVCQAELESSVPDKGLPTQQVVVLLHGLMRSANSMHGIADSLTQGDGSDLFTVVNFEYASTRGSIGEHAEALREVVHGLPKNVKLSFVGHSMGNIVVRHFIGDLQRAGDQETLDRLQRIVMIGPPNQGACIARQLAKTGVYGWVTGKGGMELGPGWDEFEKKLAIPPCLFGIVAGRLPEGMPTNPLVDGQGDFVVGVEETKLDGAADFLEVPNIHSFFMDDPVVQKAVNNFLRTGKFN